MNSKAVHKSLLTTGVVARRLTTEMETLGFIQVSTRPLKLVKKLNEDTEIFFHPGVMRSGVDIRVDPVIGVDNVTLRTQLLSFDKRRWKGSARVCHAYLGILASWSRFYLRTMAELDHTVAQIVKSMIEVGLPVMSEYDTLDKVRQLFREEIANTKGAKVIVLFAKEKLAQIERH